MQINNKIIERLKNNYKNPKTALNYTTHFELLVATILSAQCTDERVNKITPFIFAKYKNVAGFAKANPSELENEIHACGFFRSKTKSIIETSQKITAIYKGIVPDNMNDLLTLRGVARKTANIILSSCFKKAEGIAVDTHVARLAKRFNFSNQKDPNKIEQDLIKIFDKNDWILANYLLVEHGRNVCKAINPNCKTCFLNDLCPYILTKKPIVTIKFAQSLDGKLATKTGESKWISNEKALKFAHELRAKNDAILVGVNTVLKDDPMLNTRLIKGKSPIRIILDSTLKTPIDSKIINTAKEFKTIIFTLTKDREKIKTFEEKNVKIVSMKTKKIEIEKVFEYLHKNQIKTLLVEGGGQIITNIIKENLFDKIYILTAPIFIGNDGIAAFQFTGNTQVPKDKHLKIIKITQIDNNVLIEMER